MAETDLFSGSKLRKQDTIFRPYLGDYLHLTTSGWFEKLQKGYGDNKVVFSGVVNKINKYYRIQERVLVVTDQALYNCDPSGDHKVLRRIPLTDLRGVSVSRMRDGILFLHIPETYDYMLESYVKKTEIIKALQDQYKNITSQKLELVVDNKIQYSPTKKGPRNVEFVEDETVGNCLLENLGNQGLRIRVSNDESVLNELGQEAPRGHLDDGNSPFNQKKYRRRSSLGREYVGDYLLLNDSPKMQELMCAFDDKAVWFSDTMFKYNKKNKRQKRLFVITDKAIMNIVPESFELKRRIPLGDISGVSLSTLTDGFFVLHIPNEYDILYDAEKKTEIIDILQGGLAIVAHKELKINIADKIEYHPGEQDIKEITFLPDGTESATTVEITAKGLTVHVVHNEMVPVLLQSAWLHIKHRDKAVEVKDGSLIRLKKEKSQYKMQLKFFVNEDIKNCTFREVVETATQKREFLSKVELIRPSEEAYAMILPERDVLYSMFSKTRVTIELLDPAQRVLMGLKFVYAMQ